MDEKLKGKISRAGSSFIAENAVSTVSNYRQLQDIDYKKKFAQDIFSTSKREKDYKDSITRLNALLRIIKDDELYDALIYIMGSNRIRNKEPETVEKAKVALVKIKKMEN